MKRVKTGFYLLFIAAGFLFYPALRFFILCLDTGSFGRYVILGDTVRIRIFVFQFSELFEPYFLEYVYILSIFAVQRRRIYLLFAHFRLYLLSAGNV